MTVTLLISHEVKDFDSWRIGFDAHQSFRDKIGVKTSFVGRDEAKPNLVHIGFNVPSVEAAKGMLADPGLKEAMMKAGVVSAPDARIVVTS